MPELSSGSGRRPYLLVLAGLRRSEITEARWEDVDLETDQFRVRGTKTEGSVAYLPIVGQLRTWFELNRREGGSIVANSRGLPYHPSSLENLRRNLLGKHPDLPNFHRARHTLASHLVAQGVDIFEVSQLLRHSSVKTTQEFYAWASPSRLGESLAKFTL